MHTAIVEFDSLADAVGSAAQHHDLRAGADRGLVGCVVCGVVIGRIHDTADRHRLPALDHAQGDALLAYRLFAGLEQLGQVAVGKAVQLGLNQQIIRQLSALIRQNLLFQLDQFQHLLQKPGLDVGKLVKLFDVSALAQRFVEDKLAFAGRLDQPLQQVFQAAVMEIAGKPESVAVDLQRADSFLQGFLVGLADAHHFAHGAHLRAELILNPDEFLECPAGELDDHIIA